MPRSASTDQAPTLFKSIQVGRGIAALLVVVFHLSEAIGSAKYFAVPIYTYFFTACGAAGVNFFFVLSGFIITTAHWDDVGKPGRFLPYLFKRAVRIYPIFWVIFFGVCGAAMLVPSLRETIPQDFSVLAKSALLIPQDPAVVGGTGAPVIIAAWSLHYEMLFYAFFGVMILSGRLAVAIGLCLMLWAVGGALWGLPFPLPFLNAAYFALFAMGVLAGLAVRGRRWRSAARPAAAFGALTLFSVVAAAGLNRAFPETAPHPGWLAECSLLGLGSTLLIFGLATAEKCPHSIAPSWRAGLLLGDMSYVLYLVHYPVISIACKIGKSAGLSGTAGATLCGAVTLGLCLLIAFVLHKAIERPALSAARSLLSLRRFVTAPQALPVTSG
jgi:peptidoglycan/LPS O-acetylase OafA/YrhL